MLLSSGCFLYGVVMNFVLPLLDLDAETKFILQRLANLYPKVITMLDGPILFFCR
jgi:hypothetical protein